MSKTGNLKAVTKESPKNTGKVHPTANKPVAPTHHIKNTPSTGKR